MSDATKSRSASTAQGRSSVRAPFAEGRGFGWVLFAGIMLSIVGILNIVYGIAAIDDSTFFVADAKYIITDLNTWGWFLVGIGAVQFIAAFLIWAGSEWGRWIGIVSAGC